MGRSSTSAAALAGGATYWAPTSGTGNIDMRSAPFLTNAVVHCPLPGMQTEGGSTELAGAHPKVARPHQKLLQPNLQRVGRLVARKVQQEAARALAPPCCHSCGDERERCERRQLRTRWCFSENSGLGKHHTGERASTV